MKPLLRRTPPSNSKSTPYEYKNWLLLCNSQSLLYKLDELRALICVTKPLFICLTETWLTPDIDADLVKVKGYRFFRNDRKDNVSDHRRGGGTLIYVSLSIRSKSVTFPSSIVKPQGIECNCIQFVDFDSRLSFLFCVYIPPGLRSEMFSSVVEYIRGCIDFILFDSPNSVIFVCGDLNRYNLTFLINEYDLENIVDFPTFGEANLDKFYCPSNLQHRFRATNAPGLGSALYSHCIVVIHRSCQPASACNGMHLQKVYDLRRSFLMSFHNFLMKTDWSFVTNCCDVEQCVKFLYDRIYEALSNIPVSFVKFTPKTKPWITPVVLDLINKRWSAYRVKNFPLYYHYKEKVKNEIVKAKTIWSQRMRSSLKGIWSIVNDVRGKSDDSSVNHIISLFSDASTAAESINVSFSNFFSKSDFFPVLPVNTDIHNICDEGSVFNLLRALKTDKACGSDAIMSVLLKESAEVLSKPLCHIFNLSFKKSIVPRVWKIADVCPIPKSTPVCADQLRPISLLPVMSKVFEKVILKKYREPLLRSYDDCQFAYRPHSSTVCALISLHEKMLQFLDDVDVRAVRLITFDMSRAFDCIPFHLLLARVSELDLPDCNFFVNWLSSYLYDRKQRVKLGNIKSSLISVSSGVPQGSILGPILFAVYFSSYKPCNKVVHIVKYADDISLVIPIFRKEVDDVSVTQTEVEYFEQWCKNHFMSINFSKSKVLNVNFSRTPVALVPRLENTSVLKILGLLFNDNLTWSDHIISVVKKLSRRLYVLRILKSLLSHDELIIVFNSIAQSVIDYASPVFMNCSKNLNDKLLTICKRAFRIIHGYDVRQCDACDLFDIVNRRNFLALKLFKIALFSEEHVLHDILPSFSCRSERLVLPYVRTTRRVESFVFHCSYLYNESLNDQKNCM